MPIVDKVLQDAAELLNDPNHERWTYANLVEWVNAGCVAACEIKPTLYVVKDELPLVEGAVQTLGDEHTLLVRALYTKLNGSVGGGGPGPGPSGSLGKTPLAADLATVTTVDPYWMTATPDDEIDEIMYDPQTPRTFYVSPPQPSSGVNYLYAEVATVPPFKLPNEEIPIPHIYAPALVDYVLWRAYSMDAEHASQDGRAAVHYNTFKAAILGQ